ncbi:MAG: ABC transporter permease [Candidatus Delongbacteria bacterium]|nr:ABC transporter permease [Candidatus Delongbacteria bacterium]
MKKNLAAILFELRESLMISFGSIISNKTRSILTTLGIVIGVTSVVLMSTAIKGIDRSFEQGISAFGTDVLYIDKWNWFSHDDFWKMRNRPNLTIKEYNRFKEMVSLPAATAPTIGNNQTIKYKNNKIESAAVTGTTQDYIRTTNLSFESGRFFTEMESEGGRNVAVIGYEIAQKVFDREIPINKYIKIGNYDFKVIGVLSKQGSFLMGNFNPDNQVYVPINNIFKHFVHNHFRSVTISVKCSSQVAITATRDEALEVMRRIRGLKYNEEDNFSINQQEALIQQYNQTVGVIQVAGFFITGLALLVGAIGIMNIMFVSVKERTREIGVRKALGAKRRTIISQFVIEASMLCLMGGCIGLVIAVALSFVIQKFLPTSVQFDAMFLAIGISLFTGLASGMAPAVKASRLDPVDSLRYE